jgi:ligand-binding sensor domain-containing protein
MRHGGLIIALLPALLASDVFAAAPSEAAPFNPTYIYTAWSVPEGVRSPQVRAVMQSRDGYIWAGTEAGLVRFNGLKFVLFTRMTNPEIANDDCRVLAEDNDGAIWIGTSGGLLRYFNQTFTRFTAEYGLFPGYIYSIWPSRSGGVWIGTAAGLNRYKNGKLARVTLRDGQTHINDGAALFEDDSGVLWIAGASGIRWFNPETGTISSDRMKLPDGPFPVRSFSPDLKGQLWAIGQWSLYKTDGNEWQLQASAPENNAYANFIVHDPNSGIWTGRLRSGLKRWFNGQATQNGPEEWPQHVYVFGMIADHEKNFWMGTDSGLVRSIPRSARAYEKGCGLLNEDVTAICEDRDGGLWVGTEGGFSRFQREAAAQYEAHCWPMNLNAPPNSKFFINYTEADGLVHNAVRTVAQDDAGTLWIGTIRGVSLFRDGKFSRFPLPGELSGNKIHVIAKTTNGAMWLGSELGLHCWWNERLVTLTQSSGLAHNHVRALQPTPDGSLWVGTFGGGISKLSWPNSTNTTVGRSVLTAPGERANKVPGAVRTPRPTYDLASPKVTEFTMTNGLSSDTIQCFHEQSDGTLWSARITD